MILCTKLRKEEAINKSLISTLRLSKNVLPFFKYKNITSIKNYDVYFLNKLIKKNQNDGNHWENIRRQERILMQIKIAIIYCSDLMWSLVVGVKHVRNDWELANFVHKLNNNYQNLNTVIAFSLCSKTISHPIDQLVGHSPLKSAG